MKLNKGFSMVEVMIIGSIVGILMAVIIPACSNLVSKNKKDTINTLSVSNSTQTANKVNGNVELLGEIKNSTFDSNLYRVKTDDTTCILFLRGGQSDGSVAMDCDFK